MSIRLGLYIAIAIAAAVIVARYEWLSRKVEAQRTEIKAVKQDRDNAVIAAKAEERIKAIDERSVDEGNRTVTDRVSYDGLW